MIDERRKIIARSPELTMCYCMFVNYAARVKTPTRHYLLSCASRVVINVNILNCQTKEEGAEEEEEVTEGGQTPAEN